ncbi:chemosensory receptor C [Elysia marginata]|uniref:Chemosensory receptor C n=1 Tax=Elysia marginata TaxID=1093978 RepID=A0AAV4IAY6_9GAST|nr:chemosensory receptor C [Elysia marginata]
MENAQLNLSQVLASDKDSLFTRLPERMAVLPYTRELAMVLKVLAPTWPLIVIFGLFSNLINISVFLKAGVKENVSTLLLSLAVSDLTFLVLMTPTVSGMFLKAYAADHPWPFDSKFILYFFYWPAFTAYDLSAFISVSLGVTRCACVAMPLQFKLVFTKSRTVKWVIFLAAMAVALRLPVLSIFRVTTKTDPLTNVSAPHLLMVNQISMSRINDIMNRGAVVWINYTAMVTCVCVLSLKLYQASKIRRACTSDRPQTPGQADSPRNHKTGKQTQQATDKPHKLSKKGTKTNQTTDRQNFRIENKRQTMNKQKLQTKDLQVIKSVVLVCVIFIVSQAPFLFVSTFRLADPQFSTGTKLKNLFTIISQASLTLSYLNASINIFVYYNFNTTYRSVLLAMVPWRPVDKN